MIVALLYMGQASGFGGAHRAQALGCQALWLFQYRSIPDHEPILPKLFPLLESVIGSLPEKTVEVIGLPLAMMNQRPKPFGPSATLQPIKEISQFREQEPVGTVPKGHDGLHRLDEGAQWPDVHAGVKLSHQRIQKTQQVGSMLLCKSAQFDPLGSLLWLGLFNEWNYGILF